MSIGKLSSSFCLFASLTRSIQEIDGKRPNFARPDVESFSKYVPGAKSAGYNPTDDVVMQEAEEVKVDKKKRKKSSGDKESEKKKKKKSSKKRKREEDDDDNERASKKKKKQH